MPRACGFPPEARQRGGDEGVRHPGAALRRTTPSGPDSTSEATPPAESTRALAARVGRELGVHVEVARVPRLVLRAVGLFSPFMREVAEMAYQWDVPFVLDDSRFRAAFGQEPTPIDEAVAATAAWARGRFAFPAAA